MMHTLYKVDVSFLPGYVSFVSTTLFCFLCMCTHPHSLSLSLHVSVSVSLTNHMIISLDQFNAHISGIHWIFIIRFQILMHAFFIGTSFLIQPHRVDFTLLISWITWPINLAFYNGYWMKRISHCSKINQGLFCFWDRRFSAADSTVQLFNFIWYLPIIQTLHGWLEIYVLKKILDFQGELKRKYQKNGWQNTMP